MATFSRRLFLFVLLCLGCAPSNRMFLFEPSSPLSGKRIGVFYDRKIIGTFEGLDERDSREYLTALSAALERYSENATFIDMTRAGAKIAGYMPFAVKRVGFLGDTTVVDYLVPDTGALKGIEDTLDYVMLLQNLTWMANVPVEIKEEYVFSSVHNLRGNLAGFHFMATPTLRVVERDSQEVNHLGYIVWDFKRGKIIGHDKNSLEKQDFMDRGTTFAQDAELTSQRVLKEMLRATGRTEVTGYSRRLR